MNPTNDRNHDPVTDEPMMDEPMHRGVGGEAPYDDVSRVRDDTPHVPAGTGVGEPMLTTGAAGGRRTTMTAGRADVGGSDRVHRVGAEEDMGGVIRRHGAAHAGDGRTEPDMVDQLARPDNRAKLLLAIALMSLVTLIMVLVIAVDVLSEEDDPVLVDGVPCLVQEGDGEEAVLYCRR